MNQILSTNNDYNNNYNTNETKKIIIIFSIAIIVVALLIVTVAVRAINKRKNKANAAIPIIEIIKNEDEKEATIKAVCEDGINYLIYTWNDEKETKVDLNGSKNIDRIIDIPENSKSTLKVEVTSVNGVKAEKEEMFELNIDSNKPTIDEISIVDTKLQIKASDDNGIDYLTYQWEDEEAKTIQAGEDDNKNFTAEIEIKRGTYKLTIKVFDISGNKTEVSKLITGVNEPEISAIKYGDTVHVVVTHDMGFKRIEFLINQDFYVYDENYSKYDKNSTTLEFDFPIEEGENIIQVTAYSLEKLSDDENEDIENYASKIFTGKCTYEPEEV